MWKDFVAWCEAKDVKIYRHPKDTNESWWLDWWRCWSAGAEAGRRTR